MELLLGLSVELQGLRVVVGSALPLTSKKQFPGLEEGSIIRARYP